MSVYLITGATGSLGTALTHRLLREGHKVRAFARNEHSHEDLKKSIAPEYHKNFSGLVGDIRDYERLKMAIDGVTHVIHGAALKIVPICEYDPNEAIQTNIIGSINVAMAVVNTPSVKRSIFIGSDKQVEPSTLYGATKLCGMRVWLASNRYAPARNPFVGVLYGNVLGSNGSILHIFRKQAETGTIKITHKASTRFHLRMGDALNLVLNALHDAQPGEMWIPKLRTYRVIDFASVIAPNCKQEEIGLRPNEKIHEVMISENESIYARDEGNHYAMKPGVIQNSQIWALTSGREGGRMNKEEIRKEIEMYDSEYASEADHVARV